MIQPGRIRTKGTWSLYILKCDDGTLYTGITNDVARRLELHNRGTASRYTRSRLPVTIVFQKRCKSKSHALKQECAVKSLARKEKEEYIKKQKSMALTKRKCV